jgi:biotin-(acetyl-CoA carboxylase) ligase
VAFIEHLDARLSHPPPREAILDEWRRLTVHRNGDRIASIIGDRSIEGTWNGIDEHGRAMIRTAEEVVAVSAGEVIVQ